MPRRVPVSRAADGGPVLGGASAPRAQRRVRYSDELGRLICRRIACGETLTSICRTTPEAPTQPATVYDWCAAHPDFSARYWEARAQQALVWADQTIDLADSATAATVKERALQVEARKWFAIRLNQRVLGDRVAHQQLDAQGQPTDPARINVVQVAIERLDSGELAEMIRLLEKIGLALEPQERRQIAGRRESGGPGRSSEGEDEPEHAE